MNIKGRPLLSLAVLLSDHLRKHGIETVLSGGACVTIYSRTAYLSYDLDFVLESYVSRKRLREVMALMEFAPDGRHFRHADTPFIVEFLSPPLSIGEEPVKAVSELKKRSKVLRLLSPTDCVKDRLAAFYHWNDVQSLDQALQVSRTQPVDIQEIRRWSRKEEMTEKLKTFETMLRRGRGGK